MTEKNILVKDAFIMQYWIKTGCSTKDLSAHFKISISKAQRYIDLAFDNAKSKRRDEMLLEKIESAENENEI